MRHTGKQYGMDQRRKELMKPAECGSIAPLSGADQDCHVMLVIRARLVVSRNAPVASRRPRIAAIVNHEPCRIGRNIVQNVRPLICAIH